MWCWHLSKTATTLRAIVSIISGLALSKSYGPSTILDGVDVSVAPGERIGVVGRNGAGKSTLARIIAGIELPDTGQVQARRDATVQYLEQAPTLPPEQTAEAVVMGGLKRWSQAMARYTEVSEALAHGASDAETLTHEQAALAEEIERLGGWEQAHRAQAVLTHLGVLRQDALIGTLSGGEQRRVALARLLVARPDFAILDEPTNHLDADTIEWLEGFLVSEYPGAVLLITHDRYLLDRVATRTWEVHQGTVHAYEGGYERFLEAKAERLAHEARVERNRQNFLRRELEWLRRQPKARGTKQKARIDRAESALSARPRGEQGIAQLDLDVARAGKTILELQDVRVKHYGRTFVDGLSLYLTEGERIGIVGPNGSGKTTLLRTLIGELQPTEGNVVFGKNTRLAYFDQARSGLVPDLSILENVMGDQSQVVIRGQNIEPRAYLERFGFSSHSQRQPVSSLSGGERARVALAKLLRQSANLIVMDEPTNDLDVETLAVLEELLVEAGATALVVTHDRWFLDRVATSILAFEGEGRVVHYPGGYARLQARRAQAKLERPAEPAAKPKTAPQPRKKGQKLSYAESRELESLPETIEAEEARVHELTAVLADPSTYAKGGAQVGETTEALAEAKKHVEQLLARWEELESKRELAGK